MIARMTACSVVVDPVNSGNVEVELGVPEDELLASCSPTELVEAVRPREDELLEHFILLIKKSYDVQDVFSEEELTYWAESNDFIPQSQIEEEARKLGFIHESEKED
jgi:hypothetical protein